MRREISRRAVVTGAFVSAVTAAPAGRGISVETTGDQRLFIRHDVYKAEWQFRFPEHVAAVGGSFMTSARPRMEWREMSGGLLGSDWQGSDEYLRFATEQTKGRLRFITGMEVSPRLAIASDRIDLTLHLKNLTSRPFHGVWSDGGCIAHRTERFFDPAHDRSYMLTQSGLTRLDRIARSVPVRCQYVFNPAWYELPPVKAYEFFWGRSETRPAGTLMASEAADGKGAVGIAWDQAYSIRQNSDENHRCMHSSPFFGEIAPGASASRRGAIWFGDTVADVERKYRASGFVPYTGPPAQV